MCTSVIIDANVFGEICKPEYKELHAWLRGGHGHLTFTNSGRYAQEFNNTRIEKLLSEYRRSGRAKLVKAEKIRQAEAEIKQLVVKSNDLHILALSWASEARILCTRDEVLQRDFKKRLPKAGRLKRAVYPYSQSVRERRKFLEKRKCRMH